MLRHKASLLLCLNFNVINLSQGVLNVDLLSRMAKKFITFTEKIPDYYLSDNY